MPGFSRGIITPCECISSKSLKVQLMPILWHAILELYTVHLSKIRIMSLIGVVTGWRIQGCGPPVCHSEPNTHRVHTRVQLARLRSNPWPCTTNLMWPMKSAPSTVIIFSHTNNCKLNVFGTSFLDTLLSNRFLVIKVNNSWLTDAETKYYFY